VVGGEKERREDIEQKVAKETKKKENTRAPLLLRRTSLKYRKAAPGEEEKTNVQSAYGGPAADRIGRNENKKRRKNPTT